jgi:hypothetical protein
MPQPSITDTSVSLHGRSRLAKGRVLCTISVPRCQCLRRGASSRERHRGSNEGPSVPVQASPWPKGESSPTRGASNVLQRLHPLLGLCGGKRAAPSSSTLQQLQVLSLSLRSALHISVALLVLYRLPIRVEGFSLRHPRDHRAEVPNSLTQEEAASHEGPRGAPTSRKSGHVPIGLKPSRELRGSRSRLLLRRSFSRGRGMGTS